MRDYLGGDYKHIESAWNLLHGKVVDFLPTSFSASTPWVRGAVYFGIVADGQLTERLTQSRAEAEKLNEDTLLYGSPVLMSSSSAGSWEG